MAMTEAEQIITRFVAAWEGADVDELLDYFTEETVWHPMPMEPVVGKPALREAMSVWLGAAAQLGADIHMQLSDGKRVMHERTDRYLLGPREMITPVSAVFEF